MNKILTFALSCVACGLGFSFVASADTATSTAFANAPPSPSYCLSYGTSMVSVSIKSPPPKIFAGATLPLFIHIENKEPYPLSGGTIMVRLIGKNLSDKSIVSSDGIVFARVFSPKNIALLSYGSMDTTTILSMPQNLPAGSYVVDALYVPSPQFNIENPDLSYSKRTGANEAKILLSVSNSSPKPIVYFDPRNPASVHGLASSSIPVTVRLINPSPVAVNVPVFWKVYYWNAVSEANLVDSFVQTVSMPAKRSKTVSFSVKDAHHSTYEVIAETNFNGVYSFASMDVSRDRGESIIRALGIDSSVASKELRAFGCVYNVFADEPSPGTLSLSIADQKGAHLSSSQFAVASGTTFAFTTDFNPGNAQTIVVSANLFSLSGASLGESQASFACNQFRNDCVAKGSSTPRSANNSLWMGTAEFFLGIMAILVTLTIVKKRKQSDVVSK